MLFFFISDEATTSQDLRSLISENEECVDWIVNYASGVRDPIAYFFAQKDKELNWVYVTFVDTARRIDFTKGYFSN